jgi:hypothetical protein
MHRDGASWRQAVRRGNGIGAALASLPFLALTSANRIDGGQWPGLPLLILLMVMHPPSFEWSRRGALFVLAVMLATAGRVAAANDCAVFIDDHRSELTILYAGKPLLVYAFADNQFKPYVRELHTLSGLNVLRDAPADHLHHHGLMYAVRVNGANFWEEMGQPGREVSAMFLSHQGGTNSAGLPQARFSQLLHWIAPTNAATAEPGGVLLIETRTIVVTVNAPDREVAVEWRSDFDAALTSVKLTGAAYNGLGLRLPKEFDRVARHQNSENLPYTTEAKWDVTAARWSAVSGKVNERNAKAALFSLPANKGDARFFTMLNPFTYLAVTQNLEKQPIEYAEGEKFSIRYLLTVYDENKTPEFLNNRHARWVNEAKSP